MWNDTDSFFVTLPEMERTTLTPSLLSPLPSPSYELDESSYSIFFSTFNPSSPAYSQNSTGFGVNIGMLKFCMEGVGITTMGVLGLIGNILSICVLSSKRMKNSTTCFLICLAVCDIVSLLGATLLVGVPSLLTYHPEEDEGGENLGLFVFNENIVKYANAMPIALLYSISVTALTGSVLFTMALTLERYLAVCHPLHARYLCTWSRAAFMSAIILILSVVYNLPRWWEFTYVEEQTMINNLTMFRPVPTEFRANPAYDTYYVHILYVVLLFFLPVGFLIIFNILIYKEIKLANELRKNLSPTQKNENTLTRMLFGVVAVFLVCQLSPAAHMIYRYAMGTRDFLPEAEFFWCFMIALNSSVNFLIYCATGGKFREVFCDMFCCWRKSSRIRQFAASTKTTFRSLSASSTYSRNRVYSISQAILHGTSTRRGSRYHLDHDNTNNNEIIFPDGKFSMPTTPPLPPPFPTSAATVSSSYYDDHRNGSINETSTTAPHKNADVSLEA